MEASTSFDKKTTMSNIDIVETIEDHVLRLIGWLLGKKVDHLCNNPFPDSRQFLEFNIEKMARMLPIVDLIHDMKLRGSNCTQREMYYKLLNVFDTQAQVNHQIQNIASFLKIPRCDMGIFASEKGCIAGFVKFKKRGVELDVSKSATGLLISEQLLEASEIESIANYIVVVEKDSVFQTLCEQQIWNRIPCILMTGKGFPDFATRKLLVHLTRILRLEVATNNSVLVALTTTHILIDFLQSAYVGDFDPYGILIYLVFQYGSNTFEGASSSCKGLRWLGLCSEDKRDLPTEALLFLNERDTSLLQSLLNHPGIHANQALQKQCKVMQQEGNKFEIEALRSVSSNYLGEQLINFLEVKLHILLLEKDIHDSHEASISRILTINRVYQ